MLNRQVKKMRRGYKCQPQGEFDCVHLRIIHYTGIIGQLPSLISPTLQNKRLNHCTYRISLQIEIHSLFSAPTFSEHTDSKVAGCRYEDVTS